MKSYVKKVMAIGMALGLAACSATDNSSSTSASGSAGTSGSGVEDGVLTVAMEAAYAPYNWAQPTDANGAVKMKDSELYANGYDVMTAKKIAEANNWELEIKQLDWDSLIPAVQSGTVDAVIAGQSMTAEREQEVDFAGPYLYANIVVLTKKDSQYASAKSLADLAGGKVTSQTGTIWYDTLIPQIDGANRLSASESAPAMLMALETGQVDYVVTDMPTAEGAVLAYPDMQIVNLDEGQGFEVSDEDVNIGVSVRKGNTELKNKIDEFLATQTEDDFTAQMEEAVKIQPLENN
ncbi:transporter substrate-binding domain-containing protein [Corynebacterium sp. SCR221107]|uniref:transporter substrate-binding domain-containing protein n=1 Tax=Corynebacterium sp. SCR221107 TaxID=3017361 RepID=UPI0022EC7AC6|nr:transporter substrate-binding domain-containing protein [Corynebacterium sp. SCR221107]WBT09468.1 transporter substrate-binding domain-containing protein [Corynebacterium sp. SCR221107]